MSDDTYILMLHLGDKRIPWRYYRDYEQIVADLEESGSWLFWQIKEQGREGWEDARLSVQMQGARHINLYDYGTTAFIDLPKSTAADFPEYVPRKGTADITLL